jgi:hypothetical protein
MRPIREEDPFAKIAIAEVVPVNRLHKAAGVWDVCVDH